MLNVLANEKMKMRRNKLLIVCTVLAIIIPIFMAGEDIYEYGSSTPEDNIISWVFRLSLICQLIVYPVLSGFVLTFSIQKEYGDHTMINTLTAPVSRIKFLMGKVIIWSAWHLLITLIYLGIACISAYLLYGNAVFSNSYMEIIELVVKIGVFNLGTLMPVVWIAVLQRKTFYPSLLCTIIFTGFGFAGLYWPELLGSLVPWSAATLLCVPGIDVITSIAYPSVIICTLVGLYLALYSFHKQEQ